MSVSHFRFFRTNLMELTVGIKTLTQANNRALDVSFINQVHRCCTTLLSGITSLSSPVSLPFIFDFKPYFSTSSSHRQTNLSSSDPSTIAVPPSKRKAPASPVSVPSPPPTKKLAMASDASDEDIFDYDDEEGSDIDYADGDSSIDDGIFPARVCC